MIEHPRAFRNVLWLIALSALHPGCTPATGSGPPDASTPAALPALPGTPGPTWESLAVSNLRFRYDAQARLLRTSYEVRNHGATRARAALCVAFVDKDGYLIRQNAETLEYINLGPGDSDTVEEVESSVLPPDWTDATTLGFFIGNPLCVFNDKQPRGPLFFLDKSGHPLAPGAGPEVKKSNVDTDPSTGPRFQLSEVRLTQDTPNTAQVSYVATNLTRSRASAELCVRIAASDAHCPCERVPWSDPVAGFGLGSAASARRTEKYRLSDSEASRKNRHVMIYLARLGCDSPPEEASSNIVFLDRPDSKP